MKRLMRNPYRKESSNPELEVILQDEAYFPGDTLVGMVRLTLDIPFDMITLEVEVTASERSVIGGFLYTSTNPEVRRTVYYQQFATLMGMSHDLLVANSGLKQSSIFFRPAAYLPTRKDAPPAQFRPVDEEGEEASDAAQSPQDGDSQEYRDSASRRSSASLYNPSTFGDTSGLDVVQLLPGSYTYPFAVPLPATVPPSNRTVHGREAEANLSYTVTARLVHKNGKSHFKASRGFEVVALSVQLQRWLQLHRRNGNGMTAEEAEGGTGLSRQTSDVANASGRRGSTSSMTGTYDRDDDDEGKVSLRRSLNHTLQFTAEELERDEQEHQREERHRRKEKKRKQKAAKQTALTVESVEGLDDDGAVFVEASTPVPEVVEQDEEDENASNEARAAAADKQQEMEALLQLQQWEETFSLPLRNSVLKKALVGLHVVLNTVVLARGYSRLCVTCMVDNTQGTASISRVKYTLITRRRVMSKKELFKFEVKALDTTMTEKIEKGKVARIDSVDLVIPPETPLTMITDGAETRTFLNIRLYVSSPLKTYSRSVEIEVLVTNGVDTRNMSRRLRTWSCYFKDTGLGKKSAAPSPCLDLSAENKAILLLDGAEALLPAAVAASGTRRSQVGAAPNFERATFTPLASFAAMRDRASGDHLDPMTSINPFAEEEEAKHAKGSDDAPYHSLDVREEAPMREYPAENES